jgi:hypothetical protein
VLAWRTFLADVRAILEQPHRDVVVSVIVLANNPMLRRQGNAREQEGSEGKQQAEHAAKAKVEFLAVHLVLMLQHTTQNTRNGICLFACFVFLCCFVLWCGDCE